MNSFPFDSWMRLAVTFMHISPSEFWGLSVCNWLTLCTAHPDALTRNDFDALLKRYPDERTPHDAQ